MSLQVSRSQIWGFIYSGLEEENSVCAKMAATYCLNLESFHLFLQLEAFTIDRSQNQNY